MLVEFDSETELLLSFEEKGNISNFRFCEPLGAIDNTGIAIRSDSGEMTDGGDTHLVLGVL